MRFMILVKATQDTEAAARPSEDVDDPFADSPSIARFREMLPTEP